MVIVVTELIAIIGGHGKLTGHCVTVALIYIEIKYSWLPLEAILTIELTSHNLNVVFI